MIYIGIDQSKRFSHYTIGDERGKILKRIKIANQEQEIRKLMESLPEEPKQAALEASRAWGWLHDQMEQYTEETLLGNPLEMKAIAHAKVKTDTIDSETIYHLLRTNLLPTCYVPTPEIREIKNQIRFRSFLIALRGRVKNQIHILVDRNHVLQPETRDFKGLFSQKGLEALVSVSLPERERQILDELLKLEEGLEHQIETGNSWVEALYEASPEAKLLDTIPGLHHFLSVLVRYEIGAIERFRDAKKLSAYAGLVPSTYASGGKVFQGKITKRGNSHLRWGLVEAVTPAVMSDVRFRAEYERIRERKGTKVARVAIARKLLEWVYRVWKKRRSFQALTSQPALYNS